VVVFTSQTKVFRQDNKKLLKQPRLFEKLPQFDGGVNG
jgi:hypothetical protein